MSSLRMPMQNTLTEAQLAALLRSIDIAKRDTGQPRRVANFLLALADARVYGGWNPRDLLGVSAHIADDMVTLIAAIAYYDFSAYELGLQDEFEAIARRWRPRVNLS